MIVICFIFCYCLLPFGCSFHFRSCCFCCRTKSFSSETAKPHQNNAKLPCVIDFVADVTHSLFLPFQNQSNLPFNKNFRKCFGWWLFHRCQSIEHSIRNYSSVFNIWHTQPCTCGSVIEYVRVFNFHVRVCHIRFLFQSIPRICLSIFIRCDDDASFTVCRLFCHLFLMTFA